MSGEDSSTAGSDALSRPRSIRDTIQRLLGSRLLELAARGVGSANTRYQLRTSGNGNGDGSSRYEYARKPTPCYK